MRVLQSSVFRALCAIIVGVLLIKNPDNTVLGLTIVIGVMFLLSGIISCAVYFATKARKGTEAYDAEGNLIPISSPTFPIVGIGSAILGATLTIKPYVFVEWLMYVLGTIIILGALNQFIILAKAARSFRIPKWFWICPSVILLVGLYIMVKPIETAGLPLLITGWCMLLYGVSECINAVKIYRETKRLERYIAETESEAD